MAMPLLAPMRVAPAAIIAYASARLWMPPAAFTPMSGPTVSRIRRTSSTFAPALEKPVEVFTKSALAFFAAMQALTFS